MCINLTKPTKSNFINRHEEYLLHRYTLVPEYLRLTEVIFLDPDHLNTLQVYDFFTNMLDVIKWKVGTNDLLKDYQRDVLLKERIAKDLPTEKRTMFLEDAKVFKTLQEVVYKMSSYAINLEITKKMQDLTKGWERVRVQGESELLIELQELLAYRQKFLKQCKQAQHDLESSYITLFTKPKE